MCAVHAFIRRYLLWNKCGTLSVCLYRNAWFPRTFFLTKFKVSISFPLGWLSWIGIPFIWFLDEVLLKVKDAHIGGSEILISCAYCLVGPLLWFGRIVLSYHCTCTNSLWCVDFVIFYDTEYNAVIPPFPSDLTKSLFKKVKSYLAHDTFHANGTTDYL